MRMTPGTMDPAMAELLAARFRALGDPTRLRLLAALQDGERAVGELVDATACVQGNVSRHMQLLHTLGIVRRRREGQHVYYSLADIDVALMCAEVCDRP